jgi:hypothetical protein
VQQLSRSEIAGTQCHRDASALVTHMIDANLAVSVSHAYEVKRIGLGRGEEGVVGWGDRVVGYYGDDSPVRLPGHSHGRPDTLFSSVALESARPLRAQIPVGQSHF